MEFRKEDDDTVDYVDLYKWNAVCFYSFAGFQTAICIKIVSMFSSNISTVKCLQIAFANFNKASIILFQEAQALTVAAKDKEAILLKACVSCPGWRQNAADIGPFKRDTADPP